MPHSLLDQLQASLGSTFAIERELGGGGMSRVFLAQETRFNRRVVIKVLSPELAAGLSSERFEREVQLAAALQDAHIVPVLGAGEVDGLPYYTMPFVDGESLRAKLDRGRVPIAAAVSILRDVALALEYAHGHGVVHRDIKPENVLLSSAGRTAVVADFGIAKAVSASKAQAPGGTITVVGTSLGTPAYMAPEQAAGDEIDPRADLYAWGVMAYEILADRHVFAQKTTAQQLIAAHIAEVPQPLADVSPDVPPRLSDLVMRTLQKSPDARPDSATALLASLDDPRLLEKPTATAVVAPQRSYVRHVVGAFLVVAALIGGVIYSKGDATPSRSSAAVDASGAINTVAVLPFVNTGGDTQDEYFSDGLTEELANAVSRIPNVRVAGRSSSYAYKGKPTSAQEIGKALAVGGVIEGTVRRSGDRLRVTAQLASTADGKVVWSNTYESSAKDVFQIQDEFTRAIVAALSPTLQGQSASVASSELRGTTSVEAYDLYLKGRYFWGRRGVDGVARAVDYFQRAIDKDPKFARAHAGLALAYGVQPNYDRSVRPDSAIVRAIASARRALALDSASSDAHTALAYVLVKQRDFRTAEVHFGEAIRLEPNSAAAHHWHALALGAAGRLDEAVVSMRRAMAIEPLSATIANSMLVFLVETRQYPAAIAEARRVFELDSTFTSTYGWMALAQLYAGQLDSAVVNAEHGLRLSGRIGVRGRLLLVYAGAGRWADADRIRSEIERPRGERPSAYERAMVALVYGQPDAAVPLIEESLLSGELLSGVVFSPGCDPQLDPLKQHPGFIALMGRHGMRICPETSPWPVRPRAR